MQSLVKHYLAEYEKYRSSLPSHHARSLDIWHLKALEYFTQKGFPNTRSEAWQYTARRSIMKRAFHIITKSNQKQSLDKISLQRQFPFFNKAVAAQLVFVNGTFINALSTVENASTQGLSIQSLGELCRNQPEYLINHWMNSELQSAEDDSLDALNQLLSQDGAVIEIAPDHIIEQPIELLFLSDTEADQLPEAYLVPIRNLIRVAKRSSVTLIERYYSLNSGFYSNSKHSPIYCTNAVTELTLEPEATCTWYHKAQENPQAGHIGKLKVTQQAHSHLSTYTLSLGSALVRRSLHISLEGESATCMSRGLSISTANQFIDHQVTAMHHAPHTESDVHYRAIANGQSQVVFGGDVQVAPGTFKIKAKQNNHNLLLSPEAEVDSKPRLTILADDVICTHGATVGQLNENALFYLRTRGISIEKARAMLVVAFSDTILKEMPMMMNSAELQTLLTHETTIL